MSNEVYIVGGGPSLRGFDWNRLRGKDVIAVNRAYEVIPSAKYIYIADWDFYDRHQDGMHRHQGQIVTGYAKKICRKKIDHKDVMEYELTGIDGLDTKPGRIRYGRNGGYASINVAYHLGYKKIYLLGFDMGRPSKAQSHWHDGHPRIDPDNIYPLMIKAFESIVEPLKLEQIEVFNTNAESKLTVFPFIKMADALHDKEPCEKIQLDL